MTTLTTTATCERGCKTPREHLTDCPDTDTCTGCLPRTVHSPTSRLCERCHLRLSTDLADVPGQHALLLANVTPSTSAPVRAQPTATVPDYWPTESTSKRYMHVSGGGTSTAREGEPIRLACLDAADELADHLSAWVNAVATHHGIPGPIAATTQVARERNLGKRPARHGSHHVRRALRSGVSAYGSARPTAHYSIETAARWLRHHLHDVEQTPGVLTRILGLRTLMGSAHALAPWRPQVRRLDGIPCPSCHRHTLRHTTGQDIVTCITDYCAEVITWDRYLEWLDLYRQERA